MFVPQMAYYGMQRDCVDYMLQGRLDETRTAERSGTGAASSAYAPFFAMQAVYGGAYLPSLARSEMLSAHPGKAGRCAMHTCRTLPPCVHAAKP